MRTSLVGKRVGKPHVTQKIAIKIAHVDKGMIPVVKWLNSFESVVTKFSCEGHFNKIISLPYVVFSCDDLSELFAIVNKVGSYGVVKIRPSYGIRTLDYCIEFYNKSNLTIFSKELK